MSPRRGPTAPGRRSPCPACVANANRGSSPNQQYASRTSPSSASISSGSWSGPDVDVGVVLDELADPGQAATARRTLVPVEPAVLAVAQRQVAVRAQLRLR